MASGSTFSMDIPGNGHIVPSFVDPPLQRLIDFDQVSGVFRIMFSASTASGGSSGNLEFRIGGTLDNTSDGTLIWTLNANAAGFSVYSYSKTFNNVWSGLQLLKIHSPGVGGGSGFSPTILVLPI